MTAKSSSVPPLIRQLRKEKGLTVATPKVTTTIITAPINTQAWTLMLWQRAPSLPAQWFTQGPHRVVAFSIPNPASATATDAPERGNLKLAPADNAIAQAFVVDPNGARWLYLNATDAPNPALVAYLTQEAAQVAAQNADRLALLAQTQAPPSPTANQDATIQG